MPNIVWHRSLHICALTNGNAVFHKRGRSFNGGVSQVVSWNGHVVMSVAFAVCRWERIQIAMRIAVCVTLHCVKARLQQTALAAVGFENRQQRLVTCIARGGKLENLKSQLELHVGCQC